MITSTQALMEALQARGLAGKASDSTASATRAPERPWYVGLLLGASGWIAGAFLLAFVFMLFKPDTPGAALVAGLVLLGAAWGLFTVDRDGVFVSQLALALSIAGQCAVLFAASQTLFKGSHSISGVASVALVLQVALIIVIPNRLHRIMSTLLACVAWALAVRYGVWDRFEWNWVHTDEARNGPSLVLAVMSWGVVWLPLGGLVFMLVRREAAWMSAGWQTLLRPVSIGVVVGLALATLSSHPIESFSWHSGSAAERQSWLALWPMLSAMASLAAMAAAFALGSRALMGVCAVAVLLHTSHFYYAMGTSLLTKSVTMLILGALLLAGSHLLNERGTAS